MTKSQKITFVGLCVAAVAVPAIVLRNRNRPSEPFLAEIPMSDGVHRYRLLKVTEGPLDYDWKDPTPPLIRMLPPPISPPHVAFIPVHLDGLTQFEQLPGISFLFRPVDAKGRYSMGPRGFSNPRVEFEESTGFVFRGPGPFSQPTVSHFGTAALTASAFPRRDSTLKILIHESHRKGVKPLVMEVPNPYYKADVPMWKGEPLPAIRTVESLSVRLNGLRADHDGVRGECFVEDKTKNRHLSYDSWLEDATGNRGRRLSPFEPAWKLHISIEPLPETEFPTEQIWKIGTYLRPKDETFVALKPPAQISGVTIDGAVLAGKGRLRMQDGKLSNVPPSEKTGSGFSVSSSTNVVKGKSVHTHDLECGQPFLWIRHSPVEREAAVLARAVSGDKVIAGGVGRMTNNNEHSSIISFEKWPDDQSEWTLELIITERPHVEFLVAPPQAIREELMKPPQF